VNNTLAGVGLFINHRIQHVDNSWFAGIAKNYVRAKSQVSWGAGLYYWTGQLHTVQIFREYIIDREIIMKGSYNGDIGAYAELGYEYQFQPKVNLGIKGPFFWIVSGSYASSVALFPFIKLNF
jgi:hypothetical protein